MKSLIRTTIVLVVLSLAMGNFALAQNAPGENVPESSAEPTARARVPVPTPSEPLSAEPPETEPPSVEPPPPSLSALTPVETTPPTASGPRMLTLSGRIGLSGGEVITGLSGVEIQGLPGNPVTDENGFYSATVPYGFSGTVRPVKKGYFFQPNTKSYQNITENLYKCFTAIRIGPPPIFGRNVGREVLVIPATDVKAEDLTAITEDLQVMSYIFDERFREPRLDRRGRLFADFGDFFGRDSRATEAIYLQGYGALFLMELNFAFSPPPKAQEKQAEETEDVDPIWQQARQQIFSPKGFGGGSDFVSKERYSAEKIDQLKTELIKTLKHAANIRNLKPDEWIILTVIGQGRQPGKFYEYFYRNTPPSSGSSTSGRSRRSSSRLSSSRGGGFGGGYGVPGGSAGGYGGGMPGGMGGMMGGMGMGSGMMGGMAYSEMAPPSATVLTIRVKKSDVDAFAKGELDFEQFQQKVQIFTY